MLFRKKRKSDVDINEIRKMSRRGMKDREIIKKLKKEGYSANEIERAMLAAVRENIDSNEPVSQRSMPIESTHASDESMPFEEMYEPSSTTEALRPKIPRYEDIYTPVPELQSLSEMTEEMPKPEVVIEELVEGVVEEKWKKMDEKLENITKDFNTIRGEIKQLEEKIHAEKSTPLAKDIKIQMNDMSARLDELDARIGGLERAFKQILPSLSRNIENLSEIIHKVRKKSGDEINDILKENFSS